MSKYGRIPTFSHTCTHTMYMYEREREREREKEREREQFQCSMELIIIIKFIKNLSQNNTKHFDYVEFTFVYDRQ